ncbi:MAG: hypothetical protein ACREN2_03500 [Candidatus Dormibacteria bacterium]
MRRTRRAGQAAFVLAVLVVTFVPVLAQAADQPWASATFAAQSQSVIRSTNGVRMTNDDTVPTRAFAGPSSMLSDPSNPLVILAATVELRSGVCRLLRSDDGGQNWHILPAKPSMTSLPYCSVSNGAVAQSFIAWGKHDTLYYALTGYDSNNSGPSKGHMVIQLAKSTDLGNSWNTVLVDDPRTAANNPSDTQVGDLVVDASGSQDAVYVGLRRSYPSAATGTPLANGEQDVSVSTDGGNTFGTPVNLNTFSQQTLTVAGKSYPLLLSGGPFLAVHGGVIEAVSSSTTPSGVTIPSPTNVFIPMPHLVARSTDQGRTWTVNTLGPPIFSAMGGQTGMAWTPKGGSQGTFIAVFAATPSTASTSGWESLVEMRSTDAGQSWSDPTVVNDDDPSLQYTSFCPLLQVAPNGRVDLVWETNRAQVNDHFAVYYTYSGDGGATWAPNVQASDQGTNFDFGISYNGDIRQPAGVASANQYAAFGWADTRLANATTQTQDVYGAMSQFASIPSPNTTPWPLIVAIVDGLATAAVIGGLVAYARRRQRGRAAAGATRPPVGTRTT